jgi:hypothetical protein
MVHTQDDHIHAKAPIVSKEFRKSQLCQAGREYTIRSGPGSAVSKAVSAVQNGVRIAKLGGTVALVVKSTYNARFLFQLKTAFDINTKPLQSLNLNFLTTISLPNQPLPAIPNSNKIHISP